VTAPTSSRGDAGTAPARATATALPAVTATFWIIKVITTGAGETASDTLGHHLAPPVAVAIAGALLVVALAAQLTVRRYVPWVYWSAVTMVSVFGTMAADALHVGLGMPYVTSTVLFAVGLGVVLGAWWLREGTLAIHSVTSRRRECFYWATVLATFALGTAVGDLTATVLDWGYLASGAVFLVAISVPAAAHRWLGLGAVPAFWIAYVLTRPLGASFADWGAAARAAGGLDIGAGTVTVVLLALIVVLVARLTLADRREALDRRG